MELHNISIKWYIYLGYDSGDTKLSLKGGASDGFLTWDGSNLNIQGSINITGGATADSISALNSATESLETGVNNSVLSGSSCITHGNKWFYQQRINRNKWFIVHK